ncbi:MAG: Amuc_1102 family pilus-like protein [Luteolibacter sp.]
MLRSISLLPILALALAFSASNASAQQAKVVGDKPAFDDIRSPEFSGAKPKSFTPKDWLEIEAKLRISMSPEPLSKTCERLTVKWYVAVKNPEKPGSMLLLTKEVEHVNAPIEEDVYCSVYLSPSSIKRLTGFDRAGKSSVEAVGYEVLINGERVCEETSKFKAGWWNSASDKISRSDTVPLLNKSETPFAAMWWDRFIEVSAPRAR